MITGKRWRIIPSALVLAVALLFCCRPAFAQGGCEQPDSPSLSEPQSQSKSEVDEFVQQADAYIKASNHYRDCLADYVRRLNSSGGASVDQIAAIHEGYDNSLATAKALSAAEGQALTRYREASQRRATTSALLAKSPPSETSISVLKCHFDIARAVENNEYDPKFDEHFDLFIRVGPNYLSYFYDQEGKWDANFCSSVTCTWDDDKYSYEFHDGDRGPLGGDCCQYGNGVIYRRTGVLQYDNRRTGMSGYWNHVSGKCAKSDDPAKDAAQNF